MNVNRDADVCMEMLVDIDLPAIEGIPCEMTEEFRDQRNGSENRTDRATVFTSNSMSSRNSSGNLSSLVDSFIAEERYASSNSSIATTKASVGSTDRRLSGISMPTAVYKENKFPIAPPSSPEQSYVVRPLCQFNQADFGMSPTAALCLPSEFSPPTAAAGLQRVTARLDSELDNWDLHACGLVHIPEEDDGPDGGCPLQINIPRCTGEGDASADEAGSGIEVDDDEEGSIATSLAVEVASLDDDGTYVGYGEEAGSCMYQQQHCSGGALSGSLSDLDCPAAESDASSDMHSGSSRGYTYGNPADGCCFSAQGSHIQHQQSRRHSQQQVSSNSPPAFRPQRMHRTGSTSPESLLDDNCGASLLSSTAFATFSPHRLGLGELGDEPGLEEERYSSAGAREQRWWVGGLPQERLMGDGGDSVSGSKTSTDHSSARKRGSRHKRNPSSPRRTGTVYRTAASRAAARMGHPIDTRSAMLTATEQDCGGKRKREVDATDIPRSCSMDNSEHLRNQKAPCIDSAASNKLFQSSHSCQSAPIAWDTQ